MQESTRTAIIIILLSILFISTVGGNMIIVLKEKSRRKKQQNSEEKDKENLLQLYSQIASVRELQSRTQDISKKDLLYLIQLELSRLPEPDRVSVIQSLLAKGIPYCRCYDQVHQIGYTCFSETECDYCHNRNWACSKMLKDEEE